MPTSEEENKNTVCTKETTVSSTGVCKSCYDKAMARMPKEQPLEEEPSDEEDDPFFYEDEEVQ